MSNVQLPRVERRLSCSKNDSKAIGKGRTHGGSRRAEVPVTYCQYLTVMRLKERLLRGGGQEQASALLPGGPPPFGRGGANYVKDKKRGEFLVGDASENSESGEWQGC